MHIRLTSVLCILLASGCTSSEPENASYAPTPAELSVMPPPPPPPAPALVGQLGPFPVNGIATAAPPATRVLPGQGMQLPANGIATASPALQDEAGQMPANAVAPVPGCHTVDNVTLCDAPADPSADETQYTN